MNGEGGRGVFSVLKTNLEFGNVILTTDVFKGIERIGNSRFNSLSSHVSVKLTFISGLSVVQIHKD